MVSLEQSILEVWYWPGWKSLQCPEYDNYILSCVSLQENIQGYLLPHNHKHFESQVMHLHKRITWKLCHHSSMYTFAAAVIAVKFGPDLLLQMSKLSKAQKLLL